MDPMLEVYLLENTQLIEQLEEMFLNAEQNKMLTDDQINEVFRIMHTIKGSSAMMSFDSIAKLAHRLEDLFSSTRETAPPEELWPPIFDLVLEAVDIFKEEMEKISAGGQPDVDTSEIIDRAEKLHSQLKGEEVSNDVQNNAVVDNKNQQTEENNNDNFDGKYFKAYVEFQEGAGMETIRAFGIVNELNPYISNVKTKPEDLNSNHDDEISDNGFVLNFMSAEEEEFLRSKLEETILLKTLNFSECANEDIPAELKKAINGSDENEHKKDEVNQNKQSNSSGESAKAAVSQQANSTAVAQSYISVNVEKIDKLMSLMGEIVTTESMVIKNPDIADLKLENFDKQARLLRKLTNELQDVVMSIRMVPISSTFQKMKRIVRDMSKKINKEVTLELIGEKTEVDKNVIDKLSDPLMHLIRNSIDHGIETAEERVAAGKDPVGKVVLEAKNSGGDVIVIVSDDGKGLDREKLIAKAIEKGLTNKSPDEISDKEAYNFILMAGFSTKAEVTEFSGRGVGMDVVRSNIEEIGGSISIDSVPGKGMEITMHIPLTLAIIEGMNVSIGEETYVIPILNIQESLEGKSQEIIVDPSGNEMTIIRGEALPIIRLYEQFGLPTEITDIKDGILVLVNSERGAACLFVDKLIGEQQAVIKPIPSYISKMVGKLNGVGGCTIMGDGSISLIADVNGILGTQFV